MTKTNTTVGRMNLAFLTRQRLIDFLLDYYGTVNRSAIMDYFGISTPQASSDIKAYIETAPHNIVYDTSAKTYRRGDKFKRVYP